MQATQLAQLRPIIEGSQQGKDALERHLTLVKRLKKSAEDEVNKELEDFKEYTEKYSDMPYADYQKMKRSKKEHWRFRIERGRTIDLFKHLLKP